MSSVMNLPKRTSNSKRKITHIKSNIDPSMPNFVLGESHRDAKNNRSTGAGKLASGSVRNRSSQHAGKTGAKSKTSGNTSRNRT